MGTTCLVVNPDRREFLDPVLLMRSDRFAGVVTGPPAQAVLLLTARGTALDGLPHAGSWHGDRVLLAGDGDAADLHGVRTALPDRPDRNLVGLAEEEYTDLSLAALALVASADRAGAAQWAAAAAQDDAVLVRLAAATLTSGSSALRDVLAHGVGTDWEQRYRKAAGRDTPITRRLYRAGA
ncbi:hypothetical protein [Kineosporia sp. A_224]|uniref:hypothetical protein n=1 Tax=Kineosporia sp. A_224 TaxID=1962180 RepID=UPI000B4B13D4|nr:hypothetical protein [Kineosporia sp. A_224]